MAVFTKWLALTALIALAALIYKFWFPMAVRLATADLRFEARYRYDEENLP